MRGPNNFFEMDFMVQISWYGLKTKKLVPESKPCFRGAILRNLAYLDGTSAGMIGGAIAAGFTGVVVFLRMQIARIKGSKKSNDESTEAN